MSQSRSSLNRAFVWSLVCIALAVTVAIELTADNSARLPVPTQTIAGTEVAFDRAARPADLPPLSEFDETIERPLFHPTRRPVLAAAVAPANQPPPSLPRGYSLRGIVVTPDGRTALFQTREDDQYLRVQQGETVEGWIVDEINPDHVLVRRNDVVETWTFEHRPEPAGRASRATSIEASRQQATQGKESAAGATEPGHPVGPDEDSAAKPSQAGEPAVRK